MQLRRCFSLLIVDDDAKTLATALNDAKVWGIPLEVYTCPSGPDAHDLVRRIGTVSELGLVIVAVTREADDPGIELCRYLRSVLDDRVTPIVVRGGAGRSLDRSIVDRFELSACLSRQDLAAGRLHAVVKSCLRQQLATRLAHTLTFATNFLIPHARSRDTLVTALGHLMAQANVDRNGDPVADVELHHGYFLDGHMVGSGDYAVVEAAHAARRRLRLYQPIRRTPAGELRVDRGTALITLPGGQVELLARTSFDPIPDLQVEGYTGHCHTVRNLWRIASGQTVVGAR